MKVFALCALLREGIDQLKCGYAKYAFKVRAQLVM